MNAGLVHDDVDFVRAKLDEEVVSQRRTPAEAPCVVADIVQHSKALNQAANNTLAGVGDTSRPNFHPC